MTEIYNHCRLQNQKIFTIIIININFTKMTDSPKKRPNMVGIQAYTDDVKDQPEIDSPMRKKKRNLGSLDIKP